MPKLLDLLNGKNYFTVNREVGRLLGNNTAIFLGELLDKYDYFSENSQLCSRKDLDGWFYLSADKVTERTNLSRYQQQTCIKKLIKEGIISYTICPFTSQRYFFVNKPGLCVLLAKDESRDKLFKESTPHVKIDNGGSSLSRQGASYSQQGSSNSPPIKDKETRVKNPEEKKDIVSQIALQSKYKTLNVAKRFGAHGQSEQTFLWLKDKGLQTDDGTLCYWAKTYSLERLSDVYRETCRRTPANYGAYMRTLLNKEAVISFVDPTECAQFAIDFKNANNWASLKIGKNYVTFDYGRSKEEISLRQTPENFGRQLVEKYQQIKQNRY